MNTILALLFLTLTTAAASAGTGGVTAHLESSSRTRAKSIDLDSTKLEKDLQGLPWKQFKAVVEAEPRLKSAIDAYGPLGWQFVQANYRHYGWKKNIDKLDDRQKKHLAEQIDRAKMR